MPWLSRFGLHLAAAIGATGVLLVATTVGAMQTRQAVTARNTATALSRAELVGGQGEQPGAATTPAAGAGAGQATPVPRPAAQANPTPADSGAPPNATSPARRAAGPGGARAGAPNGAPPSGGPPPPAPGAQGGSGSAQPGGANQGLGPLPRQHSVTGAILEISGSDLTIRTPAGREGIIRVAPKAVVRLVGKGAVPLDALQPGDRVVAVGQQVQEDELRAVAVLARRPPAR